MKTFREDPLDRNLYILDRFGQHNTVIACFRGDYLGAASAATSATHLIRSFKAQRSILVVGVGGGVPSPQQDIRLGDVVVSVPSGKYNGVVELDRGKVVTNGHFQHHGRLKGPPLFCYLPFRNSAPTCAGQKRKNGTQVSFRSCSHEFREQPFQDRNMTSCSWPIGGKTCQNCDKTVLVARIEQKRQEIHFHYGNVASGNQVMKDGASRDRISQELGGVLCFEMESAGVMDNFPCLAIGGICDYCDTHKNEIFQPYAAATAAAHAKALLCSVDVLPLLSDAHEAVLATQLRPKDHIPVSVGSDTPPQLGEFRQVRFPPLEDQSLGKCLPIGILLRGFEKLHHVRREIMRALGDIKSTPTVTFQIE